MATEYTPGSPNTYSKLDAVRVAIGEAEAAGFFPNAVILHPTDMAVLEMEKATDGDEQYLMSNPRVAGPLTLWGRSLVTSNAMTPGTFLTGDFVNACELFQRAGTTVELSREHGTNFTSNLCTLLAEERVALAVYQPAGLRKGTF
jgi:HK97 family phage major capsid protein